MLGCDRIRILAVFSSGKVMAKSENSYVFLAGYTCYENQQSSCRPEFVFSFEGLLYAFGFCRLQIR
jgi:hypothetical protein